jgi:hypothetical protein
VVELAVQHEHQPAPILANLNAQLVGRPHGFVSGSETWRIAVRLEALARSGGDRSTSAPGRGATSVAPSPERGHHFGQRRALELRSQGVAVVDHPKSADANPEVLRDLPERRNDPVGLDGSCDGAPGAIGDMARRRAGPCAA